MNVTTPLVGSAGQASPVTALPAASANISAQALAVVSSIAADTALSVPERSALVAAVASFDQQVISKSTRDVLFSQVEGLGTYLRNTSSTSWPRWQQLTALRVYGLNVEQGAKSNLEEVVIAQAKQHLEAVAHSARNVNVAQAVAAARQATQAPVVNTVAQHVAVAVASAPKVEVKVDAPKVQAPVVKVDKLV